MECAIPKSRGTKVNSLDAFFFGYHPNKNKILAHLIDCGRKFVSLMGVHHRQYRGDVFYVRKGKPIKIPVNCRIIVDAANFQKANPNYTKPRINGSEHENSSNNIFFLSESDDRSTSQVKSNGRDPADMTEDDLILCSPTVPGVSYGNKLWGERDSFCAMVQRDTKFTLYSRTCRCRYQKHQLESHVFRSTLDSFQTKRGYPGTGRSPHQPKVRPYVR